MNRLRLLLTLVSCLLCPVAAFAQGKTPKPLDQLSAAEKEAYNKALGQYREGEREQDKILQDLRKTDPAFQRASHWLDNERLKASTQFNQLAKDFTGTLNTDTKRKYRQWLAGYSSRVYRETLDNEWKNVPEARPALLFLAEQEKKKQEELASNRKSKGPNHTQEAVAILDLQGSNSEKWDQYENWLKQRNKSLVEAADALERELGIPSKLKSELHRQAADNTLFLLYDTYYRLHLPPDMTTLRKQVIASVNELNKLRPGWEVAEGIESPTDTRRPGGRGAYQQPGPSYLLVGQPEPHGNGPHGCGAVHLEYRPFRRI